MSAIVLPGVVPVKALAQLRKLMAMGPFVSGKLSAVGRAASIKDNLLLARGPRRCCGPRSAATRRA
jgi:hypothetical protein